MTTFQKPKNQFWIAKFPSTFAYCIQFLLTHFNCPQYPPNGLHSMCRNPLPNLWKCIEQRVSVTTQAVYLKLPPYDISSHEHAGLIQTWLDFNTKLWCFVNAHKLCECEHTNHHIFYLQGCTTYPILGAGEENPTDSANSQGTAEFCSFDRNNPEHTSGRNHTRDVYEGDRCDTWKKLCHKSGRNQDMMLRMCPCTCCSGICPLRCHPAHCSQTTTQSSTTQSSTTQSSTTMSTVRIPWALHAVQQMVVSLGISMLRIRTIDPLTPYNSQVARFSINTITICILSKYSSFL